MIIFLLIDMVQFGNNEITLLKCKFDVNEKLNQSKLIEKNCLLNSKTG